MKPESTDALLTRIEDLESRLEEAEQLIEAIKAGEVDAFAVHSNDQAEVYTLQSGDYAYRILIENFSEGALNLSEDGLIVYTNSYFCELIGLPYERVVGRSVFDLIDPAVRDVFNGLFAQAISGSSKGEISLEVNGRVIPVYISLSSLQPQLPTVGMIINDLTEKKANELEIQQYQRDLEEKNEELQDRNQFVERLINSSLDLIMVVDHECRFITLNKKAESVLRAHYADDPSGQRITDSKFVSLASTIASDIQKAFVGEIVSGDEVSDGLSGNFYEHHYIPLINQHNEIYSVMVISHDITQNKKQIEELKALAKSDKSKSDFVKMASHELKTPVTSIKGYIQLMLAMLNENNQKKPIETELISSFLIKTDNQVLRLTRLVSELLDLSRIEEGQLDLNKEVVSINDLVTEVVQDLKVTNPTQLINLEQKLFCLVEVDKDRMIQVLYNVMANAIKYSPRAERVDVSVHPHDGGRVAISIQDYGIGINRSEYERIFERFYRSEDKSEQTFPGFGIGLFISKEIMLRHKGNIIVKSEKGKGSTFTLILDIFSDSATDEVK